MNKLLAFLVVVFAATTLYLVLTQEEKSIDVSLPEFSLGSDDADDAAVEQEEVAQEAETAAAAAPAPSAPVVSAPPAPTPTPKPTLATHDADGNVIVRYTTYGFTPQTVEIKPGDAVRFINNNILPMWVKAQEHPTAEYFEWASLNQGRSSYQGESYIFTFTQPGSWGYTNLNKDEHKGAVIVLEN
jgi:plastocyanin